MVKLNMVCATAYVDMGKLNMVCATAYVVCTNGIANKYGSKLWCGPALQSIHPVWYDNKWHGIYTWLK